MAKGKDADKPKKKMGRPTDYTPELAGKICELIASSPDGLTVLCKVRDDLPNESTVYQWLAKYDDFSKSYREAKEAQGLCYSEKVMKTVWDVDERPEAIAKAKLILDASKWHLSKLAPKTFGDKPPEQTSSATSAQVEEIAKAVKELNKKHERDY
jgi:hypothetical protein